MKNIFRFAFIGLISLQTLSLSGCGTIAQPSTSQATSLLRAQNAASGSFTPVEKPDFVYSKGIYPQYLGRFRDAVKSFMAEHVTPADVTRFDFGGWTAPDDAQIEIKFYGIKDMQLFKEHILPDLKYYLAQKGL
jgi:hypothetical protein